METIAIFFAKIIKSNVANISKSTNEYYQKNIEKSGHKMDIYPALTQGVEIMNSGADEMRHKFFSAKLSYDSVMSSYSYF